MIATHDLMLPIDNPEARVLLVRSCTYAARNNITAWEADLLPPNSEIEEELKRDIVGARRRIIFVEGDEASLDKPIYSVIFPDVSIRAKGSAREVQQAVQGIRATESLHWVQPFGIIDNDGRESAEVQALRSEHLRAAAVFSGVDLLSPACGPSRRGSSGGGRWGATPKHGSMRPLRR